MPTTISGTSGVTYPAGGTDNVAGSGVGTSDTQTLTNKTLTTPTIATIKSASTSPTVFQNSSGTEVGTLCRAWVNFDGTTSPGTIRASFNVSSVTRNSTGDYTINFTNAFSDTNYSGACMVSEDTAGSGVRYMIGPYSSAVTTTAFRVGTYAGTTLTNMQYVQAAFFR